MTIFRSSATMLGLVGLVAVAGCSSWDNHRSSGPYSQASAPVHSELTPGMVQQVQTKLQQQGLYHGGVDGLWGPETQTAVQGYQQSHGLTANGQIDSPTLASLNLASDGTLPAPAAVPSQAATPAPAAASSSPPTN